MQENTGSRGLHFAKAFTADVLVRSSFVHEVAVNAESVKAEALAPRGNPGPCSGERPATQFPFTDQY